MSVYLDNVLNRYETYTYNWAVHMCNPGVIGSIPLSELKRRNLLITLAESGVENEITINRVEQLLTTANNNPDRISLGNTFKINFIEVGGITFYTRIFKAAQLLGIDNHLRATYVLELNFKGWDQSGSPNTKIAGPYLYACVLNDLGMSWSEGASVYTGNFTEVKLDAFNQVDYTMQFNTTVSASNFGEFLRNFQTQLNEYASRTVAIMPNRKYPDRYVLNERFGASDWAFGALDPGLLEFDQNISVNQETGGATLSFQINRGSTITSAIILAMLCTENFRRIPVSAGPGEFAKPISSQPIASADKLAQMVRWITFDTNVKFLAYDNKEGRYAKEFSYTAVPTLIPKAVNDPDSTQKLVESRNLQEQKLAEIFRNNQLRKRYDYIHTGLNTEVTNLDIVLHQSYYAVQALFNGLLSGRGMMPIGGARPPLDDDPNAALKRTLGDLQRRLRELNNQLNRNQSQEGDASVAEGVELRSQLQDITNQIENVTDQISQNASAWQSSITGIDSPTINRNRYLTQSELYDGADTSTDISNVLPPHFRYDVLTSPAMTGPDTGTNDVGAAQIGAMHTNVTQVFDQLQINLSIKGDPYWLGGRSDGANYQVGGVGLFLNVGVPRYPDDNTGLMLNKDDIFTYVISGFYVARNVMAVYSDGRFDMQLDCYRDTTLATNLVYPLLAAGRMPTVRSEVSSLPDLTNSTDNNPQDIANITDTADSFGPRAVGSDPPGGSSLPGNLNASLVTLLTNTANTTGVTINVTPEGGVRTGANNPSGRHDGSSADIVMTSNGRVLSVNNPADRPIILSFTETFVNNAKATGFVPSVGIGNPNINPATGQRYPDYMGNSAFHFDIARTPSVNPTVANNPGAGSAWSGSSATAWVPIWPELRRIIE